MRWIWILVAIFAGCTNSIIMIKSKGNSRVEDISSAPKRSMDSLQVAPSVNLELLNKKNDTIKGKR